MQAKGLCTLYLVLSVPGAGEAGDWQQVQGEGVQGRGAHHTSSMSLMGTYGCNTARKSERMGRIKYCTAITQLHTSDAGVPTKMTVGQPHGCRAHSPPRPRPSSVP